MLRALGTRIAVSYRSTWANAVNAMIPAQPRLHSESQANLGYIANRRPAWAT